MNLIERLREIVTVEPLIALFQMALCISKPALDNLEFEKACRVTLRYNSSVCDAILSGHHAHYNHENKEVQTAVGRMHTWQQPVQSFVPLLLVLFLGSFSDRHKCRKPFFLMPLVGELLGVVGCILCVLYMSALPLEAQGVFQKIIPSWFGGQTMVTMASTSFIADITAKENRTFRLGILQLVVSVVLPTVHSFSGLFFVHAGYITVLATSGGLYLIALIYGWFWIKEPASYGNRTEWSLSELFHWSDAKDTVGLLIKRGQLVWILVLMAFLHRAAFDGESNVLYLYTQNVFHWTPLEFSYLLTATSLMSLTGQLIGMPLFTKVFHFSDITILFVTVLDKIFTNLVFGLAKNSRIFYIGVAVGIVTRVYRTAKKSLATKMVDSSDIGKTQSLLGISDVLAPALFVPIYNWLYLATFDLFSATIFFFSMVLYGLCIVCTGVLFWKNKMRS
ncbi:proton-coupled folate transporter-like [Anthonomus grandis grandis]|uniref:proton-coupled folate transporter-like n=1 Tax=Anthonomus grandis grandis TaxID=2921223 RepID=UPI0021669A93|nr:proton-coupled folate transporter-like [Anthonomus grandis grandis]